jgi:hypothetical protein
MRARPASLVIAQPGGAPPLRVELPPESALSSETARELVGQRIGLDFERRQGAGGSAKAEAAKVSDR